MKYSDLLKTKAMRLVLTTSLLLLFVGYSKAQFPPLTHQLYGGSELILRHRPDLSDSSYQLFMRYTLPCKSCAGGGFNLGFGTLAYLPINFYNTCNYTSQQYVVWFHKINDELSLNPFTGDSASKRIFNMCSPQYPEYIVGPNNIPATHTILPGFQDTFVVLKDYWYSKVFTLPEKCATWQLAEHGFHNFECIMAVNVYGRDLTIATNLDSTDYFNYGPYQGLVYSTRGITQINTTVSNSSPYFLSYPVAHYPKNTAVKYQQHAVDPDGDSLVWSSLHMVWYDTVHGIKPLSYWSPFIPQKECPSAPYYNMPFSAVSSGLKKVPGYECIPGTGTLPNCIKYDPVYNPFDTDSTYYLNPSTGEVSFTAKSAPQTARLLLRCDEYRQGVWVGAVNRRVDFFITDSMYYHEPNFSIDSTNLVNCYMDSAYVFYACKNQPLSLPFRVKTNVAQAYLRVVDNHGLSLPTASLTYQNNNSDSVRGELTWTPGNSDTGWHHILVRAYDSVCTVSPHIREYAYLLRIYVSNGLQLQASDTTLCAGQSVLLQATGLGNNVTWTQASGTPNSLSCSTCAAPWASPLATSVYIASGSSTGLNCVSNDTVTVGVIQDFSLSATDTTVCFKNDLMLQANASGSSSSLQYQWTPTSGIVGGSNNSFVLVVPQTTSYVVSVSDSLGCFVHSDTASIVYDSTFTPSYNIDESSICTGDTVSIAILGGVDVTWSPNYHISSLQGNGVLAWPDTSVSYTASMSNANHTCKTELNIPVEVTALRADAGPDREIYDGEAVYLGGSDMLCGAGCNLQWYPDKWLFFNFQPNPKAVPHVNTTYWVVVSNSNGSCVDRDSVTIRVKCTDIYIPNAFNPESRGNEYTKFFGPRNVSLDMEYFRVFNRWGELVFESRDVGYRWDGKYRGEPQPVGTYVWVIKAKCPDGQYLEKKGNVLLVR